MTMHTLESSLAGDEAISRDDEPVISRAEVDRVVDIVLDTVKGDDETHIFLGDVRDQVTRWSRNRIRSGLERRRRLVRIDRTVSGTYGYIAVTNQIDAKSLVDAIQYAERVARKRPASRPAHWYFVTGEDVQTFKLPNVTIWSDVSVNVTPHARTELAATMLEKAASQDMKCAGSVYMKNVAYATHFGVYGLEYSRWTHVDVTASVRHISGRGSGWAGISTYDWQRVDSRALAEAAYDRSVKSINPVRVEPGRYTVVLEPQAVGAFLLRLIASFDRQDGERGKGPFAMSKDRSLDLWMTKLGLRVADERVTLYHDPAEPGLGVRPKLGMEPITWIERGVLTTLSSANNVFDRHNYDLPTLNRNIPQIQRFGFKMAGGGSSVEEMIRTTKRGLYVSRFSNIFELDESSVLCTGLTRDGVWLIENGAVTKAVNNLRFVESPMFMLNNLDQIGEPIPIHLDQIQGSTTFMQLVELELGPFVAMVPPLKAHDFNFVALVEAV